MKEEVNFSQFCDRFKQMNRDNNFSYEGKRVLFDYLEDYEEDTGEELELDIIALCCEFCEYGNIEEYLNNYYTTDEINEKIQDLKENGEGDISKIIEEEIRNKTTLIKLGDDLDEGFIIRGY